MNEMNGDIVQKYRRIFAQCHIFAVVLMHQESPHTGVPFGCATRIKKAIEIAD